MSPHALLLAAFLVVQALADSELPGEVQAEEDRTEYDCFSAGECFGSSILSYEAMSNSRSCHKYCQSVSGCRWFTYHPDTHVCLALAGCFQKSDQLCPECVSGQRECPRYKCGLHGRCLGALVDIRKVSGEFACHQTCQSIDKCKWHTYNPDDRSCLITEDCPTVDKGCERCTIWEKECLDIEDYGMGDDVVKMDPVSVELNIHKAEDESKKEDKDKEE